MILVDTDESGTSWHKFLCVKVLVDIMKPLARGRLLNIGDKRYCIPFKYEKMPIFCFHCGVIKHINRMCSKTILGCMQGEEH